MNPPPLTCPICSSPRIQYRLQNSDFLFRTTGRTFSLFRCPDCGAGLLDPPPTDEELRAAYPQTYWWGTRSATPGFRNRLEEFYRTTMLRHHVRLARRHFPISRPRVLDIGCGNGSFLHLLQRRTGVRGEGLEISPDAAAIARERYGLTVHVAGIDGAEIPAGAYDLITMFHVLEHLRDPRAALDRIASWLAPGGCLLLQVPNLDSWQSAWFGCRWTGIDIPRHLLGFTPRSLALAVKAAGLIPGDPIFFSLRDNAAAMASSLCPGLDPMAAAVRGANRLVFPRKILYFGCVLLAQPAALLEAACRRGGTLFLPARQADRGGIERRRDKTAGESTS